MNHKDAVDMAARMNKHAELTATIVRILPEHVDPPKLSDNGWDVEITTSDEYPADHWKQPY